MKRYGMCIWIRAQDLCHPSRSAPASWEVHFRPVHISCLLADDLECFLFVFGSGK